MTLTAYDVQMAKSILQLVNPCVKSNPIEYIQEIPYKINCIIIIGEKSDGSCRSLYTCIFEMTPAQLEAWGTYKDYLRRNVSFVEEIPEQGITLIGWF